MKQIRSLIPDVKEERIFSFIRDDDGFFRKIEKVVYRDRFTNEIKQGEEIIHEEMYRVTIDDEYDDELSYQGCDGSDQILRLKIVKKEHLADSCSSEDG